MLKKIAAGFAVLVLILVAVIATRPATFEVQRSATMAAAPATVHAIVNDPRRWAEWSPWEELDPDMKKTFSGAETGVGAIYEWEGNKDVGKGVMTIRESKSPELVRYELAFVEPFESVADTTIAIKPEGDGSQVTWTMSGKNNFIAKAFSLVMDMDSMIGSDFEKGLAKLTTVAEAAPVEDTTVAEGAEAAEGPEGAEGSEGTGAAPAKAETAAAPAP